MKLTFKNEETLPAIRLVSKAVGVKNSLPILACIRFESSKGVVFATASNGDSWLSIILPNVIADEDFTFAIDSQDLIKVLGNMGEREITMELDKQSSVATIKYDKGKAKLPFYSADEFPMASKDVEGFEQIIDGGLLTSAVSSVLYATGDDELRPVMSGVLIELSKECMTTVATDGQRLVRYVCDKVKSGEEDVKKVILHKTPASILLAVMQESIGDVKICFNERLLVVSNKRFKMTTRLIEGKYPNYAAVIPDDMPIHISVSTKEIIDALKRVLPLSDSMSRRVTLQLSDGVVTVKAEDIDFSRSATEQITCDYNGGNDMEIGFKGESVLDAVRNIADDDIVIELQSPEKAAVIYAKNTSRDKYLALLMPMRIN